MARAPAVNKLHCFARSLLCFTWHFAKHWRDPRFPSALFGPDTKKPDDASASIGIVMR
ncbi:hypothetical protein [Mesorhizobium sp.]|uniref:hypothetical protein n=1 Tax=Mesorhizobium sp. TaxID=1871066 RepID=UPI00257B0CCF|nr:hypothetical protein [Mesorhizobium sp.]